MSTISSSTTSTTAYKVTADTTGTLVIQTGATPTTAVTVDASQNVGIGTSSPSYKLQVAGSIKETQSSEAATTGNVQSTFAASFQRTSTDTVFNIGYATTPDAWVLSATYGTTGAYKPITFATSDTERMRIDSSGNVGIGTSSPVSKLQVVADQTSYVNDVAQLTITGTNTNQRLFLGYNTSTDKGFIQATKVGTAYQDLVLQSGGGNVGIGTTNPSRSKLVIGATTPQISFTDTDGTSNIVDITRVSGPSLSFSSNGTEVGRFDNAGLFKFNSGYGSAATAYGCRAWVNFNGTGTVAIRASGNVSSITDGGVGIYRVNFTSSMPDANFTTVASSAGAGSVNNSTTAMLVNATSGTGQTANVAYVDVWCYHPGNQVAQDDAYINVSVFR